MWVTTRMRQVLDDFMTLTVRNKVDSPKYSETFSIIFIALFYCTTFDQIVFKLGVKMFSYRFISKDIKNFLWAIDPTFVGVSILV